MGTRLVLAALLLSSAALAADRSVSLKISGWHSKGDLLKTETAVRAVKGVKSASADLAKKELAVVLDDAVASEKQVEDAVAEAGYTVGK